jgi:UDP-N-acetylmuramoylalanine--D-glutamate ligase
LNTRITRPEDLAGSKATVMGLGLNGGGLAVARFLAECGAEVTVTDMKDEAALSESVAALEGLPIRFVLGRHELADFSGADFVVKNPAVRPDSPYLAASRRVETDLSLFLQLTRSPIVAVTGSKGKSSTASAIRHGLVAAGFPALLGGNIAVSPLSFLSETGEGATVVLELSSWQLADLRGMGLLRPKIAVLTSIMPDHMNRYRSMDEYVADKRLIYADQDEACHTVCGADDSWGRSFAAQTRARVSWYAAAFAALPGAWLEEAEREPRGFFSPTGRKDDAEMILGRELLVPGPHQRKNLLAPAQAVALAGATAPALAAAMSDFPGVEHRLERFAEQGGIAWFNDSAATIPQAVAAALGSFPGPTVLITGGTDKNLDFEPVRSAYRVPRAIVLLAGSGTEKLRALLDADGVAYRGPFDRLEAAVAEAADAARSGDTVILSPGCTSFGMFANEFDRGRKFKESVRTVLDGR